MSTIAFDQFALTRIADFARSLSRLHQASRRQLVEDDAIDREFNAVCMSVWGYTTDDFSDDLFSLKDHAFLDALDEARARIFAAEHGYDLVVVDPAPARGLVQPRQGAGEVRNAGERELIEGDGGHVVLTSSDRPYILCRHCAESL